MSQILHIFRKDLKHHWPEIAISLTILAAYTWKEPGSWGSERAYSIGLLAAQALWGFLPVMLLLAWGLLIVRVVQGESLVGDRQFWVTRPYDWPKLLAAKALFIVTVVNVPLFIAQVVLLGRAGFAARGHISELLLMQLFLSAILVLPLATAAAITSTVLQVCLIALGLGLYEIAVGSLDAVIPNSRMDSGSSFLETLTSMLVLATCIFVILWQYSRRKAWQSRTAIICLAAILVVIGVATPYGRLIARAYPAPSNGRPPWVQLALRPPVEQTETKKEERQPTLRETWIKLPLFVSGIASDSIVGVKGIFVTIEGGDGFRWESRWLPQYELLWPDTTRANAEFTMDKAIFERVKSAPVDVHISFALTRYREEGERTAVITAGEFSVPGVDSRCRLLTPWSGVTCSSPFSTPKFLAIVDAAKITCRAQDGTQPPQPAIGRAIATEGSWDSESHGIGTGIDPVVTFQLVFSSDILTSDGTLQFWNLCPGTPITFLTPRFEGRSRAELGAQSIKLGDYEERFTARGVWN